MIGIQPAGWVEDTVGNIVMGWFAPLLLGMGQWIYSMFDFAFTQTNVETQFLPSLTQTSESTTGMVDAWALIMLPFVIIMMALQVVLALARRQLPMMARAVVAGVFGIPMSYAAVWIIVKLDAVFNDISSWILTLPGSDGSVAPFMTLLGFTKGQQGWIMTGVQSWLGLPPNTVGYLIGALLIVFVAWIFSLILGFSMVLRGVAITLLAGFAPLVLGTQTFEATKVWLQRWAMIILGLMLAKPLAASVMVMTVAMFRNYTSPIGLIAALVGIIIASAMPAIVLSLVNFTATAASEGVEHAFRSSGDKIAQTGRKAVSVTRTAVVTVASAGAGGAASAGAGAASGGAGASGASGAASSGAAGAVSKSGAARGGSGAAKSGGRHGSSTGSSGGSSTGSSGGSSTNSSAAAGSSSTGAAGGSGVLLRASSASSTAPDDDDDE